MFRPKTVGSVGRVVLVQLLLILVLGELLLHIYNPLPFRVRGNRIVLPVHQRYKFHRSEERRVGKECRL